LWLANFYAVCVLFCALPQAHFLVYPNSTRSRVP